MSKKNLKTLTLSALYGFINWSKGIILNLPLRFPKTDVQLFHSSWRFLNKHYVNANDDTDENLCTQLFSTQEHFMILIFCTINTNRGKGKRPWLKLLVVVTKTVLTTHFYYFFRHEIWSYIFASQSPIIKTTQQILKN